MDDCMPCEEDNCDERSVKKQRTVKELQKLSVADRTSVTKDGVWGLCSNCTCDWRRLDDAFMPKDAAKSVRRAHLLKLAIQSLAETTDNAQRKDLLQSIVKLRKSKCSTCASKKKLSPKELACKTLWETAKYETCKRLGGCPNADCPEKGMASWIVLQANHKDPNTKVHQLSDYLWWSAHGGVEAMKLELEKVEFLCGCCHRLLPSSTAGKKRTKKFTQYEKDGDARAKEKQDYVDARKVSIGACQYEGCGRQVTLRTTRSFDWRHRDNRTKASGVAVLVNDMTKHVALKHIQPILDAEMDKCDLLCYNCQVSRYDRGRGRWDETPCE